MFCVNKVLHLEPVFANTGHESREDLSVGIFNDRKIAEATLEPGYIQVGRPDDGSYDPICFYARRSVSNLEFSIVRLDHEEILCNDRIRVAQPMADSFYRFALSSVRRA